MDYGRMRFRQRPKRPMEQAPSKIASNALSFVATSDHSLERFQHDLQARKPVLENNKVT